MRVSGFGSCDDLLICRIEPAVTDILHYSAFEKPRILQHHCKALSQFSAVEIPHIVAVDLYAATVHVVEPHQKLDYCGLACTGRPDNRNCLPRLYVAVEVIDDYSVVRVPETYVLESHCPLDSFGRYRALDFPLVFFLLIEKLIDAFGSCSHALQHAHDLCHLSDRMSEVPNVMDEGLNVAYCDRTSCC